jgi:hypothetical protein
MGCVQHPFSTLDPSYNIAHLDIAPRFMVNGRKKMGRRESFAKKENGNERQKPGMYGSNSTIIFDPSVVIASWVMHLT